MFAVMFVDRVKFVLEMISGDPLAVRKSQNALKTNSVKNVLRGEGEHLKIRR